MGTKIICQNKRARFDYFIEDTYECGIVLSGTEIKSIRCGKVSITESFCYIKNGEMITVDGKEVLKVDTLFLEPEVPEILMEYKPEEVKDLDIDAILAHNKRRGGCCGSARGRGPLTCGKPYPDHHDPNIPHDPEKCCGHRVC